MQKGLAVMVVSAGLVAASTLAGRAAWAQDPQEQAGQYRTALSVVGGLSVGSTGSSHLGIGHFARAFGHDDVAAFTVGGSIAHDLTPRLTLEATGLYQDRGSSAWSADAGLRLNLKPSSESLVPYFAVSGGLFGESTETVSLDLDPERTVDFLRGHNRFRGEPGDVRDLLDSSFTTTTSHRTDAMMTLGGGVVLAAGPHIFVRPDARAQVVFSGDARVLGLFTLNFGYRF
jgi:hypothetical protein